MAHMLHAMGLATHWSLLAGAVIPLVSLVNQSPLSEVSSGVVNKAFTRNLPLVPSQLVPQFFMSRPSLAVWQRPCQDLQLDGCPVLPTRHCNIPTGCCRPGWNAGIPGNNCHYSAGFKIGANNISSLRHTAIKRSWRTASNVYRGRETVSKALF